MQQEQAARQIQELRKTIEYHSYRYYTLDDPEIEDYEFDRLMHQLIDLEEAASGGLLTIIGAEMVAASTGLGHMILFAQQMSRTDKVIVGILAIGAVGYVTDRLFGWMIGFVLKGSGENGWN